jgi:dynein heavy chain
MFYKGVVDCMTRSAPEWRAFYDSDAPENEIVPDYEDKINADPLLGAFLHFVLVRSFREDRSLIAANKFIGRVLDKEFVQPATDQIAQIWEES